MMPQNEITTPGGRRIPGFRFDSEPDPGGGGAGGGKKRSQPKPDKKKKAGGKKKKERGLHAEESHHAARVPRKTVRRGGHRRVGKNDPARAAGKVA